MSAMFFNCLSALRIFQHLRVGVETTVLEPQHPLDLYVWLHSIRIVVVGRGELKVGNSLEHGGNNIWRDDCIEQKPQVSNCIAVKARAMLFHEFCEWIRSMLVISDFGG